MAKSDEPTRTKTLRNKWLADFTRRFKSLIAESNKWLINDDYRALVTNQYEFTSDPQSIINYMAFLQTKIDQLILEVNRANTNQITSYSGWMVKYENQAYLRGIQASRAQLSKLSGPLALLIQQSKPAELRGGIMPTLSVTDTANKIIPVTGVYPIAPAMVEPIHLEALRIAYTRNFTDLEGITSAMSQQIRREITSGMEAGMHTRDIAKNISNRIDKIGLTRAKTLARTEVGRAFRLGSINESQSISEESGLEFKYQWLTALDERVRSSHAARQGVIYTKEEVIPLIGDVNCRCSTPEVLVIDGEVVE